MGLHARQSRPPWIGRARRGLAISGRVVRSSLVTARGRARLLPSRELLGIPARLEPRPPAQEIAEQDRLGDVVAPVAVFPIDPDVLDPEKPLVSARPHGVQDARVVDRVLLERRLKPAFAGAAD